MGKMDTSQQGIIAALVPCYHDSIGNATQVIYLYGEPILISHRIKTVLKNIAKEYTVDIEASRQKYGKMLGCRRVVPIPLNSRTIMVPLKMRRVISKNDSSRGYVNCFAVKEIKEAGKASSLVVLKDNREIKCLHSIKNLNQHLRNCSFVHQAISGVPQSIKTSTSASDYLNYPATKSDIAMLLKEIRELRENL